MTSDHDTYIFVYILLMIVIDIHIKESSSLCRRSLTLRRLNGRRQHSAGHSKRIPGVERPEDIYQEIPGYRRPSRQRRDPETEGYVSRIPQTKGSSAAAAHFQGGPAENSRPRDLPCDSADDTHLDDEDVVTACDKLTSRSLLQRCDFFWRVLLEGLAVWNACVHDVTIFAFVCTFLMEIFQHEGFLISGIILQQLIDLPYIYIKHFKM